MYVAGHGFPEVESRSFFVAAGAAETVSQKLSSALEGDGILG